MADIRQSASRTPPKDSASNEAADTQERKEPGHQSRDRDQDRDDQEDGRRVDSYRPDERRRSRSPRRDRPRRKDAGFKWKTKSRGEDNDRRDQDGGGLKRGYRDRDNRYRDDRSHRDDRDDRRDRYRDSGRGRDEERPRRTSRSPGSHRDRDDRNPKPSKTDKAALPPPSAPVVQQEMITVYVNDRLGTKKAIPCFATDRIKEFKIIVASMIGRQPHEILLKRQGERPFKDVLTLQDYGVSNNVQLDLEVDTGD